jgi:hypothetical protein
MKVHQKRLLDQGKIEKLVAAIRSIDSTNPEVVNYIRTEVDSLTEMPIACAIPRFDAGICLLARASSRPDARP